MSTAPKGFRFATACAGFRKEGRAEEREKVVLNILNSGMEEAVVANIAELSIAEVQTIRKKNNL